ncbi:hypothetical protein Dthio_PD1676 [Desulfonatronospira thiodismutans ASO3-1]|uniref:Uncharacterized protein n=1 Tax=Desulfonatronospira thiodismutans ASO3-1 TaxID=555779 RepID=D6SNJ9_9BACT|nr:hypothetical protein Dthio_PD1676 [Desulfonatronospira thiodismutans ASO3-1]
MHLNHPLEPRNPGLPVNSLEHLESSLVLLENNPEHLESSLVLLENNPEHRVSNLGLLENSRAHRKLLKATRLLTPTTLPKGMNLLKDTNPRKSRNLVMNRHSDNFQILPQKFAA